MFIPFMGAVDLRASRWATTRSPRRASASPGRSSARRRAAVVPAIGEATNSDFFRALGYIGFFLNLFNLLPVVPLDGGRAMAAMAPWMWFVGLRRAGRARLLVPQPVLLIFILLGGLETWRRWKRAQVALARAGRLLPRLAAQPPARRRRLHRPDRAARARHARDAHPRHRRHSFDQRSSAALRAGRARSRAGSRARAASRACRDVLAARERDLDLGVRPGEVDPRRHERQPALLHARREAVDLAAVHEQLARRARARGSRGSPARRAGCGRCAATARRRGSPRSRP